MMLWLKQFAGPQLPGTSKWMVTSKENQGHLVQDYGKSFSLKSIYDKLIAEHWHFSVWLSCKYVFDASPEKGKMRVKIYVPAKEL